MSPEFEFRDHWGDVVETHTAVVYFVGDHAVKLKKPVDLGFVDYTTREARQVACEREVALNRLFAPDVYLGVADVVTPDGHPLDHLVVMRRMPAGRRLATLVRRGAPVDDALRDVARLLAVRHGGARRGPDVDVCGTRAALHRRWTDNISQTRALPAGLLSRVAADVDAIEELVARYLAGRDPLFDRRVADGRIVDGHGDLLADDIFCLPDGPRVLDCLEFDDTLRAVDGLDDAAFLVMDLERLGAPRSAARFLHWYTEFSADPAPPSLRHHYVAYRAFVRAKVALMRCTQGDDAKLGEAVALCGEALSHLRAGAVKLVLVGGLPGTGKTTVAGALADRLGADLLSTDRLRKESREPVGATRGFGTGLYAPERVAAVYRALLDRAALLLAQGESVVVDATWTAAERRAWAATVAADSSADLVQLRCEASAGTAARRLEEREPGWSDADTAVAAAMARAAERWPEAATVNTEAPLTETVDKAMDLVRPGTAAQTFVRRPLMAPD